MCANRSTNLGSFAAVLFAALLSFLGATESSGLDPSCNVPPVVGVGVKPNVIFDLDFGGTLQFPSAFSIPTGISTTDSQNTMYYTQTKVFDVTGDTSMSATPTIPTEGVTSGSDGAYNPLVSYYGTFESDSYYLYDHTNDYFTTAGATQQTALNFSAPSQQGSDVHHIIFTTGTPHNFQVGDAVVPSGLTSNKFLNGNAYRVSGVLSSTTFEIAIDTAFYNGNPDKAAGTVIKRVQGNVPTGLSGNILNFATASRIDTVLKALIGGRATGCDGSGNNCQLQCQGSRRFMRETTNLHADFYVRPATLSTASTNFYPNDYTTGTYWLGADGTSAKDIFVSISGQYQSRLTTADPVVYGELAEGWTFTISTPTKVRITLVGDATTGWVATAGARLVLYSEQGWLTTLATVQSTTTNTVTLDLNLSPTASTTYYLRVAPKDGLAGFTGGKYTLWSNVPLNADTVRNPNSHEWQICRNTSGCTDYPDTIGSIPWARARVYTPGPRPTGLIQQNWGYLNMGLIVFREATQDCQSGKCMQGKMLLGADDESHYFEKKTAFVNALQGIASKDIGAYWASRMYPYGNSKRTTESLQEIWNYYARDNSNMNNADNGTFLNSACRDAYKDSTCTPSSQADSGSSPGLSTCSCGATTPVPCRKAFTILVGDGAGLQAQDSPPQQAQKLHTTGISGLCPGGDIRADLDGCQTVNIYTLYAFAQEPADPTQWSTSKRLLLGAAMFGGFNHTSSCGSTANLPYGTTQSYATQSDMSSKAPWWVAACDPTKPNCTTSSCANATDCYCASCCQEWDAYWDRTGDGTNSQKGLPDNYFEAQTGKQLADSLQTIMAEVVSKYAAASAVATVSQESRQGDAVIRGVFEASDMVENISNYLWKGHLEVYIPHTETDFAGMYDFEFGCNAQTLCMNMPGEATGTGLCPQTTNCWDAGQILEQQTPVSAAQRNIFTILYKPSASYPAPTGDRSVGDVATGNGNGEQVKLKKADLDTKAAAYGTTTKAILGLPTTATETDVQNLIDWTRGEMAPVVSGYRNRNGWLLGDIVYSTPVVVGPPKIGDISKRDPNFNEYLQYVSDKQYRDKVVYVGANDGMLHAFLMSTNPSKTTDGWQLTPSQNPQIGKEVWAYVPGNLMTELQDIAKSTYGTPGGCMHRFMVDLSPRCWQVYMKPASGATACTSADAQGRCFRTVLIGGERGGGDVYFAIDVTDPYNPIVLWEYSVLWNRVVVEATSSTDPTCVNTCVNNCKTGCANTYNTCYSACAKNDAACKKACKDALATCNSSCVATNCSLCTSSTFSAYVPYRPYYETLKNLSLSWSQPYMGRIKIPSDIKFYVGDPSPNNLTTGGAPSNYLQFDTNDTNRTVVFMGSGIHYFDDTLGGDTSIKYKDWLWKPYLLMIDVETGMNLFEYVWPTVYYDYATTLFTPQKFTSNSAWNVPYLMSDPLVLDVWDVANDQLGDDGFIDRVYVGDMNGNFYGIKFNMNPSASKKGIMVEIWPTKRVDSTQVLEDIYRADAQPITSAPVASVDKNEIGYLRVIFGTGKYDDVIGSATDKQDPVRNALYNLKDPITLPTLSNSAKQIYDSGHPTSFWVDTVQHCSGVTFNSGCTWSTPNLEGDCCQSSCASPCFKCIYDLTHPDSTVDPTQSLAGERIVGKPLIAGGVVFITTFVPPQDKCQYAGSGYLYAFDYLCGALSGADTLLNDPDGVLMTTGPTGQAYGVELSLGPGMPSRPVLDTRGENVIIQMSDGTIKRVPVQLPKRPVQFQGWRER